MIGNGFGQAIQLSATLPEYSGMVTLIRTESSAGCGHIGHHRRQWTEWLRRHVTNGRGGPPVSHNKDYCIVSSSYSSVPMLRSVDLWPEIGHPMIGGLSGLLIRHRRPSSMLSYNKAVMSNPDGRDMTIWSHVSSDIGRRGSVSRWKTPYTAIAQGTDKQEQHDLW